MSGRNLFNQEDYQDDSILLFNPQFNQINGNNSPDFFYEILNDHESQQKIEPCPQPPPVTFEELLNFHGVEKELDIPEMKMKENQINQKSTIHEERQELLSNKNPQREYEEMSQRRHQKQRKSLKETKNFLITFRLLFIDYLKSQGQYSSEDPVLIQFISGKSASRDQYQVLFKSSKFKKILTVMFEDRFLERQLQLTRSSIKVRPVYLKKIAVLKQAFEKEWFPRIR